MANRKTKKDFESLGGWVPNPSGVEAVLNDPTVKHPVFRVGAADVIANYEKKDTHLWKYLTWAWPNYRRKAQGIGSCVAFGAELAETILCCKKWRRHGQKPVAEVSTEANYGLCRVEVLNKRYGGWQDGAYGASMAKAAQNYGAVLRLNHSAVTNNKEHDLRRYSAKKEKDWGNFGCGGEQDRGMLDNIAKEHPVKAISQMSDFEDVAAAIAGSLSPVTIASSYGTDMRRDKYGQCYRRGSWQHQMSLIGIRFGKHPAALCAQSWGPNSASGPTGDEYTENLSDGGVPKNISGFTWYIPAEEVDWICRSGDCWGFSGIEGWELEQVDLSDSWVGGEHSWGWT